MNDRIENVRVSAAREQALPCDFRIVHGESETNDNIPASEALARLCNAECMLLIALAYLDDNQSSNEAWRLSESLGGILRLLDGVYLSLSEALYAKENPAVGAAG
jgi:hypothetical protein